YQTRISDQPGSAPMEGQVQNRYDRYGRLSWQKLGELETEYEYNAAGGQLSRVITHKGSVTDPDNITNTTRYEYRWWDDAKQVRIASDPDKTKHAETFQIYNANGHLARAEAWSIPEATERQLISTSLYFGNAQGQVLHREYVEMDSQNRDQVNTEKSHTADLYFSNGMQIGGITVSRNDPQEKLIRQGYVEQFNQLVQRGDKDQKHSTPGLVAAFDFNRASQAITPFSPGTTPGSYTVRQGDTLQGIAQGLWGDASLWTLLADANGLSGSETLSAGQILTVPNKVINMRHAADSFRPYDPAEAMGNLVPANVPVDPSSGCGAAQIIMIVIAIIVTIYTAGAA
ncbi:LysM peptidoglycan-binding domain-containing protein, partial [Parachitinimonas caeni]